MTTHRATNRLLIACASATSILFLSGVLRAATKTNGPLRPCAENPRYFADATGRVVWLTGSHTWANFQERGIEAETPDFDYDGYLDFLQQHGHNFIRLWVWEQAQWMQFAAKDVPVRYRPLAYLRTGPGNALDGKPKLDVTKFNDDYFRRLHQRVEKARDRGIYVSVMLFQGFSLDKRRGKTEMGDAWHGHPLNAANNINGINGNPSGDDTGHEVHELKIPEVTRLQETLVRKVIDTVGDLDNVLWEIGNECHAESVQWQYHMIRYIKERERMRPMQHPVGMTGAPIKTETLMASPADWISPPGRMWLDSPPVNDGKKVILADTDHCAPWDHEPLWVWKNLFRGNQFLLMDGYVDYRLGAPSRPDEKWEPMRHAMGRVREFAEQLDLAKLTPRPDLASTGYCLADTSPNQLQYIVFVPKGNRVTVQLGAFKGQVNVEWISAATGKRYLDKSIAGGARHDFASKVPAPVILRCYAAAGSGD